MDRDRVVPQVLARLGNWQLISLRHGEFNDLAMAVKTDGRTFSEPMYLGSWLRFNPYWELVEMMPVEFEVPQDVIDALMMTPQQFARKWHGR